MQEVCYSRAATELVCQRKYDKYTKIKSSSYIFKPQCLKLQDPGQKSLLISLAEFEKEYVFIQEYEDLRAKQFLNQILYLAIQRGNAASILGTLPNSIPMYEIHNMQFSFVCILYCNLNSCTYANFVFTINEKTKTGFQSVFSITPDPCMLIAR